MKDHPFFEAIARCSQMEKQIGKWGMGTAGNSKKLPFIKALKESHPFVFDRKVTVEKRMAGRAYHDFENVVEEFSMPYSTSLYLLTNAPELIAPSHEGSTQMVHINMLGYLIVEIDPENFSVYEVSNVQHPGHGVYPCIGYYEIQLKTLSTAFAHARALGFKIFDQTSEAHTMKEISAIMNLTNAISVKRIGIEKAKPFSLKTRGIGPGVTMLKYENVIHIADKVEYEYSTTNPDAEINWEYRGFWRGFWRALYHPKDVTDSFGRRLVDYDRIGKNRKEEYKVPGYTWVVEHHRGNADIAEIKTHTVKNGGDFDVSPERLEKIRSKKKDRS